ncbi:BamA/TamA family outer membrane protein [Carboxylicivirga linearis]|uniref:BamA/TamA family outer membrane protein n=1 Tax=Carboxylicivirga linearis TaxID=1628157 RepID=A0ABS5JSF9_9BACT|nr:BamA/TamA family outer membrane protein [Carboxylicivirga linearis]MBS2097494.1 BamA/TamA family outer membrane protein [Carboxylicivirga linearis]
MQLITLNKSLFIGILLICIIPINVKGQKNITKTINTIDSLVNNSLSKDIGVVPAPVFNPTFGTGIAVVPMAVYKHKKFTPETNPSISQGILYTNLAGSYIAGAKQTTYLNRNRFWMDAYVGYASMKYRFYDFYYNPDNDYTDIRFKGFVSNISVLALVTKYFYVGPIFSSNYIQTEIKSNNTISDYEWFNTPGVRCSYDSRDDIFYPVKGWLGSLSYTKLFDTKLNHYQFDKINLGISNYYSLNDNMVWANRVYTQLGYGTIPIHEMASPGASPILRGYSTGNYINSSIVTLQSEFRWMFAKRWGCVGFGGYGWLFDQPNQISDNISLPSVGGGLRYRIFPAFKINMACDIAFGRNSHSFIFSLSESF